jgi:carbonic anhydrase/acetyltransferase-like protein (isoleucine patch superfamily)
MKRFLLKLVYHTSKLPLKFLDGRFPRTYMKLFNSLLKGMGVKMNGTPRYISTKVRFDDFNKIQLNERTVISENVILLTHDYSLTTGLISISKTPSTDLAFIREITLGKNVFIGMGAIIMPGTVIEDNVVVGAGSVVRGVIPKDSIVIGNPGVIISTLSEKAKKWEDKMIRMQIKIDRK